MELRKQIDGRYARKVAQYDSVTGTSSSIQVGLVQAPTNKLGDDDNESDYVSAQEDLPRKEEIAITNLQQLRRYRNHFQL